MSAAPIVTRGFLFPKHFVVTSGYGAGVPVVALHGGHYAPPDHKKRKKAGRMIEETVYWPFPQPPTERPILAQPVKPKTGSIAAPMAMPEVRPVAPPVREITSFVQALRKNAKLAAAHEWNLWVRTGNALALHEQKRMERERLLIDEDEELMLLIGIIER